MSEANPANRVRTNHVLFPWTQTRSSQWNLCKMLILPKNHHSKDCMRLREPAFVREMLPSRNKVGLRRLQRPNFSDAGYDRKSVMASWILSMHDLPRITYDHKIGFCGGKAQMSTVRTGGKNQVWWLQPDGHDGH
jgi:hypothetical protein